MHAVAAFFASIIAFVGGLLAQPIASNSPPDIRATQPAAAAAAQTEVVGDPFNDPVADLAVVSTSAMPTALAFSPPPAQTIINQPIVERIIERIVPQDGAISAQTLTAILTDVGQSIENRLAVLNPPEADIPQQVAAAGNSSSYYFAPASQRIDQLSNTTINNPTISGGSISGTSITGTITNAIDTALATIGDLTSNNVTATNAVYTNATTTNLSVTNLSATATSTLSGLKLAATDCSVLGNGGKLTTDAFGNVTCAADQSGAGGSVGGLNTQVQFNDGGVFGGNAGFTYDKTAQRVAVTYASTTGVTASYASSTQGFFGTLSAGSLSLTTPLSASNGGTGIGNPASAGILVGSYGGGSWQQLATSSLGLLTSDIAEGSNLYFTNNRVAGVIAGTTTSALAEGSNLYWTNTRFDARLAATTSLPMLTTLANLASIGTISNGIWNGSTIGTPYGGTGSTTLSGILKGNGASAVQTALPGTDYELPLSFNAPLSRLGNTVSLSTVGDWSGTLGGFSAAQLIAAGFSTTSADAWKSARSFFATSSSDYWLSTKTTDNLAQGSSNKYYATSLFAADLAATTTSALAEGSNLYFTNARADQRITATSTIGTLTSAPNLSTVATSLTGFLKATAGALATAAVNLASDVTGILPVANGGTGWASIAAGAIPYGNGSSALATTSTATAGQVLAFLNGVPTWMATTTFSAPLSYSNGTASLAQANSSTNGYLSSADWTLFNGKISSSSLSAVYPLAYNSATGVFSTAFSTTTENSFNQLQHFNAGASTSALTVTGSTYFPSGVWRSDGNVGIGTTTPDTIVKIAAPGIFTNTQGNLNFQALINGATPAAWFNTWHPGAGPPGHYSTEAITGAIDVPATATVHESAGIAGYVRSQKPSANGSDAGGFFQAEAAADGTSVLGIDAECVVGAGLTSAYCQNIFRTRIYSPGVSAIGLNIILDGTTTPSTSAGVQIQASNTSTTWGWGLLSGAGGAATGIELQGVSTGNSVDSQPIKLTGTNASGVTKSTTIYANKDGELFIQPQSLTSFTGMLGIGTTTPNANLVVNGTTGRNLFQIATSTNQNVLTVTENGRVGIGTGSPGQKLHVSGDANINGMLIGANTILGNLSNGLLRFDGSNVSLSAATGGDLYIQRDQGSSVYIGNSASNKVGIGSNAAGSMLSVYGGLSVGTSYQSTAAPSNGAIIAGNVGIGTTTPYSKLTTWGTGNLFEAVTNSSSTVFLIGQNGATTTNFAISNITNSILSTNANGSVVATTTIGWNLIKGPVSSIFAFDASGNPTATTSISVNYLTGILPIANGGTATGTQVTNGINYFDGTRITSNSLFTYNGTTTSLTANSANTSGNVIASQITGTQSTGSTGNYIGVYLTPTYSAASGNTLAGLVGIQSSPGNSNSGTIAQTLGVIATPSNTGTGTTTAMYGLVSQPRASAGGVTTMYGAYLDCGASGASAVVSTCYGLRIGPFIRTGTVTTSYGLYQDDASANNYFGGNVGIGTTSPTAQLHTTGTVRFSNFGAGTLTTDASGNLSVSSDERLKTIDGAFTRGLADVLQLSPIQYHWNPLSGLDTSTPYAGFSAQNVQAAIPEAVGSSTNGYLTLQDRPLIAAAINAIKDLSAKLDALEVAMSSFAERFASKEITATNRLCIGSTCVTESQLQAILAAAGQSGISPSVAAPVGAPQAPVLELDGNASSTIELGDTYNDLGARIVAPEGDLNLGIVILLDGATTTAVSIDTSTSGEHTILYTVTSPTTGLTGNAMRTVIISPAEQSPEAPANDNPFNAEPANDNASTTALLAI